MDPNIARLMEQMKANPEALQRLLQSSEGQALLRVLQQENLQLQQAAKAACSGNSADAVRQVSRFLKTPDGAALADRIKKLMRK